MPGTPMPPRGFRTSSASPPSRKSPNSPAPAPAGRTAVPRPFAGPLPTSRSGWPPSPPPSFSRTYLIDGHSLPNVWARIPGEDSSRAVLLEGHYDVVALEGNFSPRLSAAGDELLGRGTSDMKGGLVTGILALEEMVRARRPPRLDTYLLMTCEEEVVVAGVQAFLKHRMDWWDRLEFAIVLEPTVEPGRFEIATQHPGDSSLQMSVPVPQAGTPAEWLQLTIRTGETPHASREPAYFDPNYALLQVLSRLSEPVVAAVHTDRPIDKEANALSAYASALIEVAEEPLRKACREAIEEVMAGLEDGARRQYARERLRVEITPVAGSRPGFAVADFVNALVDLKRQVTDRRYTNALYSRTPCVVAILDVHEGTAQAKVDVRTDDRLFGDMDAHCRPRSLPRLDHRALGRPRPGAARHRGKRPLPPLCRLLPQGLSQHRHGRPFRLDRGRAPLQGTGRARRHRRPRPHRVGAQKRGADCPLRYEGRPLHPPGLSVLAVHRDTR